MSDITAPKEKPTVPYYQWKTEYKQKFLKSKAFITSTDNPSDPNNQNWELLHEIKENLKIIEYDAIQMLALAADFGQTANNDNTIFEHTQFLDEILIETGIYPQFASAFDTVSHQSRLLGIEPYVDIINPNQALQVAIQIVTECANRVLQHPTDTPLNDETDPKGTNREWLKNRIKVKHKPRSTNPYGFKKNQ